MGKQKAIISSLVVTFVLFGFTATANCDPVQVAEDWEAIFELMLILAEPVPSGDGAWEIESEEIFSGNLEIVDGTVSAWLFTDGLAVDYVGNNNGVITGGFTGKYCDGSVDTDPEPEIPSDGKDNDGDGLIDEEEEEDGQK